MGGGGNAWMKIMGIGEGGKRQKQGKGKKGKDGEEIKDLG